MDDATRVRAAHALGDLARDPSTLGDTDGTSGDEVGERRAVHELHHDRAGSDEILETVDGRDVGMVDRRERPSLALEAGGAFGTRMLRLRQHLDRDVTAEPTIGGAIDLAHAACAEQRDDFVRTDSGSRWERHESFTLLHSSEHSDGGAIVQKAGGHRL